MNHAAMMPAKATLLVAVVLGGHPPTCAAAAASAVQAGPEIDGDVEMVAIERGVGETVGYVRDVNRAYLVARLLAEKPAGE